MTDREFLNWLKQRYPISTARSYASRAGSIAAMTEEERESVENPGQRAAWRLYVQFQPEAHKPVWLGRRPKGPEASTTPPSHLLHAIGLVREQARCLKKYSKLSRTRAAYALASLNWSRSEEQPYGLLLLFPDGKIGILGEEADRIWKASYPAVSGSWKDRPNLPVYSRAPNDPTAATAGDIAAMLR